MATAKKKPAAKKRTVTAKAKAKPESLMQLALLNTICGNVATFHALLDLVVEEKAAISRVIKGSGVPSPRLLGRVGPKIMALPGIENVLGDPKSFGGRFLGQELIGALGGLPNKEEAAKQLQDLEATAPNSTEPASGVRFRIGRRACA